MTWLDMINNMLPKKTDIKDIAKFTDHELEKI